LSADEELLSVLEEVIMFTFQQTVYHLTKVFYITLPSIINKNKSESLDKENTESSIMVVTDVFSEILHSVNELHVHPQIISQLFSYLFFFSNASLFNYLIEKGPTCKIISVNGGIQLKKNIRIIEEWANLNKLGDEFIKYMSSFLSAVHLLSTPTIQLMETDWITLRETYKALKPSQLQFLLAEYQLNGKHKPRGWYPIPEEIELALQSDDLLESFATHPPLVLPSSEFVVNLDVCPTNKHFYQYLAKLIEKFDRTLSFFVDDVDVFDSGVTK